jgi:hypothetical protein
MAKDTNAKAKAETVTMTAAEFAAAVNAAAAKAVRERAKATKDAKAKIAVLRRTPGLHVLPLTDQDTERNTLAHVIENIPGTGRLVVTIRQVMDANGITLEGVYGANPARFRSGDVATAETVESLTARMAKLAKAKADRHAEMWAKAAEAYTAAAEGHVYNVKAKAEAEAVDGE